MLLFVSAVTLYSIQKSNERMIVSYLFNSYSLEKMTHKFQYLIIPARNDIY